MPRNSDIGGDDAPAFIGDAMVGVPLGSNLVRQVASVAVSQDFSSYVLDQLSGLGQVDSRRMFGGVGLYCSGIFFGLISRDVLYLRVDDSNRKDYEARGAGRFRPFPDRPKFSMNYYEVPADALEDAEECVLWARRSVAVGAAPAARGRAAPARNDRRQRKRPRGR